VVLNSPGKEKKRKGARVRIKKSEKKKKKEDLPIEMFERLPGLNLNGLMSVNHMMMTPLPLRTQHPTLLCLRSRSCVPTTFLVWWWLRCAAARSMVKVAVGVGVGVHLHPRTLLLLIFRADPRSVQHTRCGLGNAFGADAHAIAIAIAIARVIARWGKICASN
jgi:hypothetical protein